MALKATDEVTSTFNEMADEKNDNNWMMTTVVGTEIQLVAAGNTGFSGMKESLSSNQDKVLFGVFRVYGVDDRHKDVVRRSPKWIFLKFLGNLVSRIKMSRLAMHATTVKETAFEAAGLSLTLSGDDPDFTMRTVAMDLLNMGGAHKPVYYDFGTDQRFDIANILGKDAGCLKAEGSIFSNK